MSTFIAKFGWFQDSRNFKYQAKWEQKSVIHLIKEKLFLFRSVLSCVNFVKS